jgi:hypothetical protein
LDGDPHSSRIGHDDDTGVRRKTPRWDAGPAIPASTALPVPGPRRLRRSGTDDPSTSTVRRRRHIITRPESGGRTEPYRAAALCHCGAWSGANSNGNTSAGAFESGIVTRPAGKPTIFAKRDTSSETTPVILEPPDGALKQCMMHPNCRSGTEMIGGWGGIRTHEEFPPGGFQDRCLQPLGHPSRAPDPNAGCRQPQLRRRTIGCSL